MPQSQRYIFTARINTQTGMAVGCLALGEEEISILVVIVVVGLVLNWTHVWPTSQTVVVVLVCINSLST